MTGAPCPRRTPKSYQECWAKTSIITHTPLCELRVLKCPPGGGYFYAEHRWKRDCEDGALSSVSYPLWQPFTTCTDVAVFRGPFLQKKRRLTVRYLSAETLEGNPIELEKKRSHMRDPIKACILFIHGQRASWVLYHPVEEDHKLTRGH